MCSSRSSATPPDASSTHTNISDTLTATTTAKVFSGVRRPLISVDLTWDRLADRRQHVLGEAEVLRCEARKRRDLHQRRAIRARRHARDDPGQLLGDLAEADQVGGAEQPEVAPAQQRADRLRRRALDLFGEAEVRLRERGVDLRLHQRLLERVAVVEHFQLRLPQAGAEAGGDVRRYHDRGEHLARLDVGHCLSS